MLLLCIYGQTIQFSQNILTGIRVYLTLKECPYIMLVCTDLQQETDEFLPLNHTLQSPHAVHNGDQSVLVAAEVEGVDLDQGEIQLGSRLNHKQV